MVKDVNIKLLVVDFVPFMRKKIKELMVKKFNVRKENLMVKDVKWQQQIKVDIVSTTISKEFKK